MTFPNREQHPTGSIYGGAQAPPRRRSRLPLLLGLVAALVLASAAVVVYLVAFSSVTVRGSVILAAGGAGYGDGDCHGTGSYADITAGATVEITDGAGKTIALGKLDPGKVVNKSDCKFTFAVDAPKSDIYGVQVSHRGVLKFSRAEVEAGVALGIGG